jgi:hypothetical protein
MAATLRERILTPTGGLCLFKEAHFFYIFFLFYLFFYGCVCVASKKKGANSYPA